MARRNLPPASRTHELLKLTAGTFLTVSAVVGSLTLLSSLDDGPSAVADVAYSSRPVSVQVVRSPEPFLPKAIASRMDPIEGGMFGGAECVAALGVLAAAGSLATRPDAS